MKLPRTTQFNCFDIWTPRYHDNKVLLAVFKVGTHNKVTFTKAPSMGTKPYYISGERVKHHKKETNGRIDCYAVPISELEPLELINDYQEVFNGRN